MKEQIKIIISDIDGTLLTSQSIISERTHKAIKKAKQHGILFGIATGRALEGVLENTKDWGIDDICDIFIGYNGAHIIDKSLSFNEQSHLLEGEYINEIINHYKDLDVNFMVYVGRTLYRYKEDDISTKIAISNKFDIQPMDPTTLLTKPRNKIVICSNGNNMESIIEHSKKLSSPNYRCFQSAPNLFEYVHPELSKTYGINKIAELHGFTLENVLAFGDADNDTDMLKDCGVGVCMENGSDASKKAANYITKSNDDEGIAIFIEEHIL